MYHFKTILKKREARHKHNPKWSGSPEGRKKEKSAQILCQQVRTWPPQFAVGFDPSSLSCWPSSPSAAVLWWWRGTLARCVSPVGVCHPTSPGSGCWSRTPALLWALQTHTHTQRWGWPHVPSSSQIQQSCYKKWKAEREAQTGMCRWLTATFENSIREMTEQIDW